MTPNVVRHIEVTKRLYQAILRYEDDTSNGDVFKEAPFIISDDSNRVKGSLLFFEIKLAVLFS